MLGCWMQSAVCTVTPFAVCSLDYVCYGAVCQCVSTSVSQSMDVVHPVFAHTEQQIYVYDWNKQKRIGSKQTVRV